MDEVGRYWECFCQGAVAVLRENKELFSCCIMIKWKEQVKSNLGQYFSISAINHAQNSITLFNI